MTGTVEDCHRVVHAPFPPYLSLAFVIVLAGCSQPSPSKGPGLQDDDVPSSGPPAVAIFVQGAVLQPLSDGDTQLVGELPGRIAARRAPILTSGGIFVETSEDTDVLTLWKIAPEGTSDLIADHVGRLAVGRSGLLVAYVQHESSDDNIYAASTVIVLDSGSLEEVARSRRLDGHAEVVGFVGDDLIINYGDGFASGVSVFVPDTGEIVRAPGDWGAAHTTHPDSGLILVSKLDDPCWHVIAYDPAAPLSELPDQSSPCGGISAAAFSLGGEHLIVVDHASLAMLLEVDTGIIAQKQHRGVFQVVWESETTLLMALITQVRSTGIMRCDLALACAPIWTISTGEPGEAWLVDQAG